MSYTSLGRRLVACLLNISEARRRDLVETVARSAITDANGRAREGVTVLNIFNDYDYNRSVITIVASIDLIREAVLSACQHACSIIDMNAHDGIHPCMGAVDLVPLYPLGEEVGLEDCGQEAHALAKALTERVPGSSAFLFGWADSQHRSLAQRRKGIGWFKKAEDISTIHPDIGPQPTRRYGITGVGASPYTMNCNVTMDTQDLSLGRFLASAIRESSPNGIPGVQVIALPHEGAVEIACNVESVENGPQSLSYEGEPWPGFTIRGQNLYHAPASLITARVAELARHHGVAIKGTALVGFTPCECRSMAEGALSKGIGEFWKNLPQIHM
ncbi:formiminotransferase N-terminal subdomain-containing protein [Triplophysa dalaica]|uniref:formiminotransferase N-terminal subdomain-containing protein n=1 Tax=Triplophysa dalaica TaxID=1582913 RepID=UPI0024E01473|nr:formiminotransferase N-terminal subdomain-containing protein [Triplophysa dalaica]XP_056611692.1 formiminotransferase N-terminal subdomain-containing protein [Triplophysa dalaica]